MGTNNVSDTQEHEIPGVNGGKLTANGYRRRLGKAAPQPAEVPKGSGSHQFATFSPLSY
jgi:hypothetical protein